jgi:uncharacterized membrane protein
LGWLVAGIALWVVSHLFKRLAPGLRRGMGEASGKGLVTAASVLALILIVIGYRSAEVRELYAPVAGARHVTVGLMAIAVLLFAATNAKSHINARLRHPMLTGTIVWAVAHLIANGDLASVVLFGSMGLWALASIVLINRGSPRPAPVRATLKADLGVLAIGVAMYLVLGGLHMLVGPNPFAG